MRKLLLTMLGSFLILLSMAQADKMYKHNGETLDVKILKVGDISISFTYPNETAEQTISRYAVAKIVYGSGRTENVTTKVLVSSKDDWENVVILSDPSSVTGLKAGEEIRGKTNAFRMYGSAASNDKKSMEKLKKAAAEMGAPFVLMTSSKDNQFTAQSIKNGTTYNYK